MESTGHTQLPRPPAARGGRPTQILTLDEIYTKYAGEFTRRMEKLIMKELGLKEATRLTGKGIAAINETLPKSKEFWKELDNIYEEFRKAAKPHAKAGGFRIPGRDVARANILLKVAKKASLVEGTEIAWHTMKSMGSDRAWERLGRALKEHPRMVSEIPAVDAASKPMTKYQAFLTNAGEHFAESESLDDFLNKVFKDAMPQVKGKQGASALKQNVGEILDLLSDRDRRLLDASIKLGVEPADGVFPEVKFWSRIKADSYEARKVSLSSLVGGTKGMLKAVKRTLSGEIPRELAAGSGFESFSVVLESTYRQYHISPTLRRMNVGVLARGGKSVGMGLWKVARIAVPLGALVFVAYKCGGLGVGKVKSWVGLGTPEKTSGHVAALKKVAGTPTNRDNIAKMQAELEVGGEKLTDEQKTRACTIAAKRRSEFVRETMTEYVRIVSILQAMLPEEEDSAFSGRPRVAELSTMIYDSIGSENPSVANKKREEFARAALAIARKKENAGMDAGAIFNAALRETGMGKFLTGKYWERPITVKEKGKTVQVFADFQSGRRARGRKLPHFFSIFRKAAARAALSEKRFVELARMFALVYTETDALGKRTGTLPDTYESDVALVFKMLGAGKSMKEIRETLSGMRRFSGEAMQNLRKELLEKNYSVEQVLAALSAMHAYTDDEKKLAREHLLPALKRSDRPEQIAAKLSVPKEFFKDLKIAKAFRDGGFSDSDTVFMLGVLMDCPEENRLRVSEDLMEGIPRRAGTVEKMEALLDYVGTHEGLFKQAGARPFDRYALAFATTLVNENETVREALLDRRRIQVAQYLSSRLLGRKEEEPLTLAQAALVVEGLGKRIKDPEKLREVRNLRDMTEYMDELVEDVLSGGSQDAGEEQPPPPASY